MSPKRRTIAELARSAQGRRAGFALLFRLRALRDRAGLTQHALAARAGVDKSAISQIETGQRDVGGMSYFTVVRLARALAPGVPTEETFPVPEREA